MNLGVYIPTYNCGPYIAETLESVLSQAVSSIKIVVVDNCSTDDTRAIVKNYLSKGVVYIRHDTNIGSIANHNYCLDIADTDYIKLLSADDVLLPGTLIKQMNALDTYSDCGIASCDYLVTDSNLEIVLKIKNLQGKTAGNCAVAICAKKVANLIGNPSTIMLRRSSIDQIRFDGKFKWMGDLRFFSEILKNTNLININVNGFLYRRHELTDSTISCPLSLRFSDEISFVNEFATHRAEPHLRLLKRYKSLYINHIYSNLHN